MLSLVPGLVSPHPVVIVPVAVRLTVHCSSNKTTLEDVTHAFPSALIGQEGSQPIQWKGDHLLSRAERVRLRDEASSLNVYDLGWRRNLKSIFCPDRSMSVKLLPACLWPAATAWSRYVMGCGETSEEKTDCVS